MSNSLSPLFADVLRACREEINARFVLMRREFPELEAESYFAFLRAHGDGLMRAVDAAAAVETGRAICEVGLELVARRLAGAGARHRWMDEAWGRLLPAAARFVAADPRRVLGAVSNAVHQLASTPGARPEQWLALMPRVATLARSADEFLHAGQVAAWRCGMAHFREGALRLAWELPGALTLAALDAEGDAAALLEQLRADAWFAPGVAKGGPWPVARAGAFRGFGGVFALPPVIALHHGQWVATSGDGHWLLTADAFGATFHRLAGEAIAPPATARALPRGFMLPADCGEITSIATQGRTLAVTASLTHAVLFYHTA